jgi:hypothetical protein
MQSIVGCTHTRLGGAKVLGSSLYTGMQGVEVLDVCCELYLLELELQPLCVALKYMSLSKTNICAGNSEKSRY